MARSAEGLPRYTARLAGLLVLAAIAAAGGAQTAAAATPPSIAATWVEEVTATSADLHAEIVPNANTIASRFEYIAEAAFQANLAAVPPREGFAGSTKTQPSAKTSVTAHLATLAPATVYRFRVVVSYPEGTVTGPTRTLGTEAATSVFSLPDDRGWEMVSPIDKNGGAIQPPESIFGGGVFQASADGDSLTYSSADSFGAEPQGAPSASQYIATRGAGGWSTQNVTEPTPSGGYGDHPDGVPFQLFSTDLARGLLLDGRRCEAEPCPRAYSLRDSATGALTPLPEAPGLRVLSASPDLSQIVFESEGSLYRWSGGGLVPTSLLPPTAGPGAAFQLASTNGRFTFYTEGGHLYRYDASDETATDLTPAGGVAGVLGASEDGASVYYQDAAGLQRWHAPSSITLVAPGVAAAAASDYPPATGTARVSPDGSHLLFVSGAELTGYENDGASEVFLYGAPPGGGAAKLSCVSCNPTGERPRGDSWIPGALANGQGPNATRAYKPRSLSADGQRVFFNSADRLAIGDSNGRPDVYEWEASGEGSCAREGGCLGLISSGRSGEASTFIDASANGSDAFFLTDSSLYPPDPGSLDLYDAREGGGFPAPPNLIPCDGDACQPLPEAPEDPTPGTLVPNAGNPPLRILAAHGKRHRRRAKHSKHRGRR